MHVGIVHGYDNILYHEDVVSYYYRIRPINSLFASESQCATLIDDMVRSYRMSICRVELSSSLQK